MIPKEKIIENVNATIVMVPTYKQNYSLSFLITFIIQTQVNIGKVGFIFIFFNTFIVVSGVQI